MVGGPVGGPEMAASFAGRMPTPRTVSSEPNMIAGHDGAPIAVNVVASVAQSASSTLPDPDAASATSKSKQGLEKILDTLSKMFPDVRRSVQLTDRHVIVTVFVSGVLTEKA